MSVIIQNPTSAELQSWLTNGKRISGFDGYFEINPTKISLEIDGAVTAKAKGIVAPNKKVKPKDFCDIWRSKDGTKALLKIRWSDTHVPILSDGKFVEKANQESQADALLSMISEHGNTSIKLVTDINFTLYSTVSDSYLLSFNTKAAMQAWYGAEGITVPGVNWSSKNLDENRLLIRQFYGYA